MLKVNDAHLIKSCVKEVDYPQHDCFEVVMLGRSNVGKSTFINKFCKRKKLAYTSSKPGKTQILNFFKVNDELTLVDVPGYGYAKVSKKDREEFGKMIETYLSSRGNLKFAVLLIDFKVGATEDDLLMYNYLKYNGTKVFIVATKKDKIKRSQYAKHKKRIEESMKIFATDYFYCYSSEDDNDMNEVYKIFSKILED